MQYSHPVGDDIHNHLTRPQWYLHVSAGSAHGKSSGPALFRISNPKSSSDATHDQSTEVEPPKLSGKMATVIANKPAPPHQKMKRPPSAVPTNTNGAKTSQSPSPSLAHKRLPSTIKHPAGASGVGVNGPNGLVNGAARLNNRRRDSQKPGDIQPGSSRPSKGGQGQTNSDKRKKLAEPYGMPPPFRLGFRS